MAVIETRDLTKKFGDLTAVDGINLEIEEGEVFGFLGPNGAGKSTTINILLDFHRPTSGDARVFGLDTQRSSLSIRQRSGFLPEGYDLYDRLTGRQHLEFGIEAKQADDDPDELLDRVGLSDAGDRKAGGYSTGMGQRLAIAMTLIGDPDLLILDEPHSGLDPNGAREMLDIFREENEKGATILFSSHIMEHVEATCDRVAIINEGEIVAVNSVEGLRETLGALAEISFQVDEVRDDAVEALYSVTGVTEVDTGRERISVTCPNENKVDVVETLIANGVTILDIDTRDMPLDELFAAYTGSGRDGSAEGQAQQSPAAQVGGEAQ